jgi:hypothetical protein
VAPDDRTACRRHQSRRWRSHSTRRGSAYHTGNARSQRRSTVPALHLLDGDVTSTLARTAGLCAAEASSILTAVPHRGWPHSCENEWSDCCVLSSHLVGERGGSISGHPVPGMLPTRASLCIPHRIPS